MARRQKAITGLTSELTAQLRLAKDPNLIVFTPVGGLGPVALELAVLERLPWVTLH